MRLANREPQPFYTVEQYLEIDRATEERYEYLDGKIWLMAGESGAHGDICMNLSGVFYNALKNSECRGRIKDTKILSGAAEKNPFTGKGMFSYPDMVIICGAPQFHDKVTDIIINPQIIIEVLSPSTESSDRGEKFLRYRTWNTTLTDYILISQDKPLVEHFIRQTDDSWLLREYHGLDKNFTVESIGVTADLADVFDRIEFE